MKITFGLLIVIVTAQFSLIAVADQASALIYAGNSQPLYDLPLNEKSLPTVTAQPWATVSNQGLQLEGPAFDRDGNLLLVEVSGGQVLKVDEAGKVEVVVSKNKRGSAGLAVHKDGRIFVAGLGNFKNTGNLMIYNSNGTPSEEIVGPSNGYLVDDIVFDKNGGLYFTDFSGGSTDPAGGVYYMPPGYKTIVKLVSKLGMANGIALSPDGKFLWVTEFATGLLHRIELSDARTVAPFGSLVYYRFGGPSPDSMRIDEAGNLYIAQYGQGRVLVLNPNGIPIGQILIPGRERGHFLRSTSMAFKPGTQELYIVASDGEKGEGAVIFRASVFTKGLTLYSQQVP